MPRAGHQAEKSVCSATYRHRHDTIVLDVSKMGIIACVRGEAKSIGPDRIPGDRGATL